MKHMVSLVIMTLLINANMQADVFYNIAKLMKVGMYASMTAIGIYATKQELHNAQCSLRIIQKLCTGKNTKGQTIEMQEGDQTVNHNVEYKDSCNIFSYKKLIVDNVKQDIPFLAGIIATYYGIKGIISTILDKPTSHSHHHHDKHDDDDDDYKIRT